MHDLGTSITVKNTAPLSIKIRRTSINQTSSYKYVGAHLDSTLKDNYNSKYKKLSFRLQLLSKICPNLNVKAVKMIYTRFVISVFTYFGTVNLNLFEDITWKTSLNSRTSCRYHHQNQSTEVNNNNELCETSCWPNCQNISHKAATSTYD